jgi:hypothetical protein
MLTKLLLNMAKVSLGQSLSDRLQKGYAQRENMIDHFIGLSIVRGKENVEQWETESTEAWFSSGEWHSVYRLKGSKCLYILRLIFYDSDIIHLVPSESVVFQALEASEKAKENRYEALPGRSASLPQLIHLGIKIQEKQYVVSSGIAFFFFR